MSSSASASNFYAIVFADRLRAILTQRGLTAAWLAEKIRSSSPYVSKVLTGQQNLTLERMTAIARVLNVPLSFLLYCEDPNIEEIFGGMFERPKDVEMVLGFVSEFEAFQVREKTKRVFKQLEKEGIAVPYGIGSCTLPLASSRTKARQQQVGVPKDEQK